MDYHRITLVGNATADAEAKESKKGTAYTPFSVAVNDGKNGEVTFFPVVAFGRTGEAVAKVIKKGQLVLVEGRVSLGEEKQFSVIADRVVFGPKPAGQGTADGNETEEDLAF